MGRIEYVYDDDVPINLSDFKNSNSNQRKHLLASITLSLSFSLSLFTPAKLCHLIHLSKIWLTSFPHSVYFFLLVFFFPFFFIIFNLYNLSIAGGTPLCFLGLEHVNKTQRRSRFNYLEKAIKIYN